MNRTAPMIFSFSSVSWSLSDVAKFVPTTQMTVFCIINPVTLNPMTYGNAQTPNM